MRRRAALALALLAAVALAPSAAAAALDAQLDVRGLATFDGHGRVEAQWVGSTHDARAAQAVGQDLQASGAARLLTYRYALVQRDPANPTGSGFDARFLDRQEEPLGDLSGAWRFGGAGPDASLRLVPAAPAPLPCHDAFAVGVHRDLEGEVRTSLDAQPAQESNGTFPAPGGVLQGCPLSPRDVAARLVATDQVVSTPAGTVDTRWTWPSPTPGIGSAGILETRVLVLDGTLAAATLDPAQWTNLVRGLSGRLEGDLLLDNAQGTGTLNGTPLPAGFHLFQAIGPMELSADYTAPASRWAVRGNPTFVAVNARPAWDGRGGAAALVAGAGLLALLLAAAAKTLRALGYAVPGLSRAEPFGNATRVGILEFVTGNPGVTVPVVAGRFQVGRATARHHLAVLERSQLVSCVRSGGAAFYTLNHETFMFPVGGAGTPTAGEAFHHFLHPARQQVRQALEALGGASYPEMAEHWRLAGQEVLPPDVVSYHCHKLLDLGLLVREPQGKAVRWRLAHRLDEALRHQRQAFLKHGGLGRLLDALLDGPASVDQVARRLAARGHRMGRAAIRGGLRVLAATGYAEDSPAGWRALAPRAA